MIETWNILEQNPDTPDLILRQSVWFNRFIKIGNKPIKNFIEKNIFISDLFNVNGQIKPWNTFKNDFQLPTSHYFKWMQLINAIPHSWKQKLLENNTTPSSYNIEHRQHTTQLTRLIPIEKLTAKQCYLLLSHNIKEKPTAQVKILEILNLQEIDWYKIYTLARKSTLDSYARMFHFKCVNNILYLNKSLARMGLCENSICSYCNHDDETIVHLFYDCTVTTEIWNQLKQKFIQLPDLTPQSAYFGLYEQNAMINHIHLIFRIEIYRLRSTKQCNFNNIINKIRLIKSIEESITKYNDRAKEINTAKWATIAGFL